MPATTTLSTTTLATGCTDRDTRIQLASTSGVRPGLFLWFDGEAVEVRRIDVDPWIIVKRGVAGSMALPHSSGVPVYIARADQLYEGPPMGRPEGAVLVSPYIDVRAGKLYFAQGDTTPSGTAVRWWQEQTNTRVAGPLGSTTSTLNPTSST